MVDIALQQEYLEWKTRVANAKSTYTLLTGINNIIQKFPDFFYKQMLAGTTLLLELRSQFRRRNAYNPVAKLLSPKIGLYDDTRETVRCSHVVSNTISIQSYIRGILSTFTTGLYANVKSKTELSQNRCEKFIMEAQDFLVKDNKFVSELFFEYPVKIMVSKGNVYINKKLFLETTENDRRTAMYQMLIMQQYYAHFLAHLIATHGYNLLSTAKVFDCKHINNNKYLSDMYGYLYEIRNVTDGHGKYDVFGYGGDNVDLMEEKVINKLFCIHGEANKLITKNLAHDKYLVLQTTKAVYEVYRKVTNKYVSVDDLTRMSQQLNLTCTDCYNIVVNCMFFVSYFNTRSHAILQYLDFESASVYIAVNQFDVAASRQYENPNRVLAYIQEEVRQVCPGEEKYVCTVHDKPV